MKFNKSFFLAILLLIPFNASAAEISGVFFNDSYLDQGFNMSLQGTGLKTVFFFKAFAAGFYKGKGYDSDLLGNFPKRIEVEYFISIPAQKLNNYTIVNIRKNISSVEFDSLRDQIKLMGKYFEDLKPGDRFSLTYLPQIGTKFAHNGKLVGVIKGERFARALFSVWIGQKPFDSRLKEEVLGLERAA